MRLRFLSFLFCMMAGVFGIQSFSQAETADLVIMIYMTGSTLESDGGAASDDLEEMINALPVGEGTKVIVMTGGSNKWKMNIPNDKNPLYEITQSGLVCIHEGEPCSMGDPEAMTGFLTAVKKQYPAKQYGLIIWDHGAGPLVGVCFDETWESDGSMDRLTMEELGNALRNSPFGSENLSFIGFDACLMGTLEVAVTVAPYADFMIASQETEPEEGWDYGFLQGLTGKETGDEIGREIISCYEESRKGKTRPVTLSCLDLNQIDGVCSLLGSFFADLEPRITKDTWPDFTRCRSLSKAFGSITTSDYDLIDLLDLISLYKQYGLADGSFLSEAVQNMIIYHFSAHEDYVHGISIYYPFDNKELYESGWSYAYRRLDFIPEYQSFIRKVSDIFMGEALLSWKSAYQLLLQQQAGSVRLSVDLTLEELKNLARSRLIVVEKIRNGTFQQIYVDYDNRFFNNAVSASYDGKALYQVDVNGEILAGPLTYYPVENGIALYGIIYYNSDPELPYTFPQKMMEPVKVIYSINEDEMLVLTDIMAVTDENVSDKNGKANHLYLPAAIDLDKVTGLDLFNAGPASFTSLDHIIHSDTPVHVDITGGFPVVSFLPVYGENTRYAYIRLTNLQGQDTCSEVVEVPNPTIIPLASDQVYLENDQLSLALQTLDLVSGYHSGLKCVLTLRNRSDQAFISGVQNVGLNEVALDTYSWRNFSFDSGEEDEIVIYIDGNTIRNTEISEILSLDLEISVEGLDTQDPNLRIRIPLQLNTAIFSAVLQ